MHAILLAIVVSDLVSPIEIDGLSVQVDFVSYGATADYVGEGLFQMQDTPGGEGGYLQFKLPKTASYDWYLWGELNVAKDEFHAFDVVTNDKLKGLIYGGPRVHAVALGGPGTTSIAWDWGPPAEGGKRQLRLSPIKTKTIPEPDHTLPAILVMLAMIEYNRRRLGRAAAG